MIRSIVFVVWMYGLMAVMGVVLLPTLLIPWRAPLWACRQWAKLTMWGARWIAGVRTEFRGLEHLPAGPVVYASKHQSMLDMVAPFAVIPNYAAIIKRELLWYPFFGWYSFAVGSLPIDRTASMRALNAMVAAAKGRLAAGRPVVIFPEGTRTRPGDPPDYKVGVFALYKAVEVPIVPVATNAGLFWPAKGLRRRPGTIVYEIGPPIAAGLDRKAFMAALETAIETATNRLVEESGGVPAQEERLETA